MLAAHWPMAELELMRRWTAALEPFSDHARRVLPMLSLPSTAPHVAMPALAAALERLTDYFARPHPLRSARGAARHPSGSPRPIDLDVWADRWLYLQELADEGLADDPAATAAIEPTWGPLARVAAVAVCGQPRAADALARVLAVAARPLERPWLRWMTGAQVPVAELAETVVEPASPLCPPGVPPRALASALIGGWVAVRPGLASVKTKTKARDARGRALLDSCARYAAGDPVDSTAVRSAFHELFAVLGPTDSPATDEALLLEKLPFCLLLGELFSGGSPAERVSGIAAAVPSLSPPPSRTFSVPAPCAARMSKLHAAAAAAAAGRAPLSLRANGGIVEVWIG